MSIVYSLRLGASGMLSLDDDHVNVSMVTSVARQRFSYVTNRRRSDVTIGGVVTKSPRKLRRTATLFL